MKSKKNILIIAIIAIIIIPIIAIIILKPHNNQEQEQEQEQTQKVLSKEEMLEQAEYISWEDMLKEVSENIARAKEKYNNRYWIGNVFISNIKTNSCDVYVKDNIGQYLKKPLNPS